MDEKVKTILARFGIEIGADSGVPLLHAANADKAWEIMQTGLLRSRTGDPHVYVATSPEIASDLGRDLLVPVRVKVDDLRVSRKFPPELDRPALRFEFALDGPEYRPLTVGRRAFIDPEISAGPEGAATLEFDP
jgi:hypothetical protein